MNNSVQTIIDAVVLNEEIPLKTRLKVINSLKTIEPVSIEELKSYLEKNTGTKSTLTNQLARNALDWLDK